MTHEVQNDFSGSVGGIEVVGRPDSMLDESRISTGEWPWVLVRFHPKGDFGQAIVGLGKNIMILPGIENKFCRLLLPKRQVESVRRTACDLEATIEIECDSYGPMEPWRQFGLIPQVERTVLSLDIKVRFPDMGDPLRTLTDTAKRAIPEVRGLFAENLLFLSLNLVQDYTSPMALTILERDQNHWLRFFNDNLTAHPRLSQKEIIPTISLFRKVFEFSGGRADIGQHLDELDITTNQVMYLCTRLLNIEATHWLGSFKATEMRRALSRMYHLTYFIISVQWMRRRFPYFKNVDGNILAFLTLSFKFQGHNLEVMAGWARSTESIPSIERLVKILWKQTTGELFVLAVLGLCSILRHFEQVCTCAFRGCLLDHLDASFRGNSLQNMRHVFAHLLASLIYELRTQGDKEQLVHLLDTIDVAAAYTSDSTCVHLNRYSSLRINRNCSHAGAYEKTKERAQLEEEASEERAEALKADQSSDEDWNMISSDSPVTVDSDSDS
ncbi:MAG: hypothetical protein Q9201_004732 [Fulgogasparrea decipioides]